MGIHLPTAGFSGFHKKMRGDRMGNKCLVPFDNLTTLYIHIVQKEKKWGKSDLCLNSRGDTLP